MFNAANIKDTPDQNLSMYHEWLQNPHKFDEYLRTDGKVDVTRLDGSERFRIDYTEYERQRDSFCKTVEYLKYTEKPYATFEVRILAQCIEDDKSRGIDVSERVQLYRMRSINEPRSYTSMKNTNQNAVVAYDITRNGRIQLTHKDITPDRLDQIFGGRQQTHKFKVLDFRDKELGLAYTKKEAIDIYLERYPYAPKKYKTWQPFIHEI